MLASPFLSRARQMMTARRWRYVLIVGAIIPIIVLILDAAAVFSEQPLTKKYYSSAKVLLSSCPEWCTTDPFSQPGMIYWSPSGLANETRWLPYPSSQKIWDAQPHSSELPLSDMIPEEAWYAAPEAYTAILEQARPTVRGEQEWYGWATPDELLCLSGRTVILIGSSHDRNNVEQLCEIIGGRKASWGPHAGGYCYHEGLDLLLANWFMYGMIDADDGWPYHEKHPFPFEQRIVETMLPAMEEHGFADRVPDLVIASSLFWDEKFFEDRQHHGVVRGKELGFWWTEIAWFRGRVRQLVLRIGDMWPKAHIMFRTRQLRAATADWHILKIFQLDQALRAVGKDMGIRLFTWGDKLEGYNKYYDNDQHFAKGPNTYLFGDMLFFYLKRAITPGCWTCQRD